MPKPWETLRNSVAIPGFTEQYSRALDLMKEMAEVLEHMKQLIENGEEGAKTDAYYLLKNFIWPILAKFKAWK